MQIVLVQSNEIREADFIKEFLDELKGARTKFPRQNALATFVALTEEVGELAECILMLSGTNRNTKNKTIVDLHREAVQVATMAARCLLDTGLLDGDQLEAMGDFFDKAFSTVTEEDVSEMFEKDNMDYGDGRERF